ncbi:hypothetical protein HNR73_000134 [Phytomonospora endophytica]|uniref:Uncharacterized protein n=1 Tax=Phytomonospora endophytica TaxID=714109 RepID=A0A841FFE9_9ACTN|nr:hypothetical protein [Phytomonospora endophytica]
MRDGARPGGRAPFSVGGFGAAVWGRPGSPARFPGPPLACQAVPAAFLALSCVLPCPARTPRQGRPLCPAVCPRPARHVRPAPPPFAAPGRPAPRGSARLAAKLCRPACSPVTPCWPGPLADGCVLPAHRLLARRCQPAPAPPAGLALASCAVVLRCRAALLCRARLRPLVRPPGAPRPAVCQPDLVATLGRLPRLPPVRLPSFARTPRRSSGRRAFLGSASVRYAVSAPFARVRSSCPAGPGSARQPAPSPCRSGATPALPALSSLPCRSHVMPRLLRAAHTA